MSKYGIKMWNIEASTLFEHNNGVRDHFEYKESMFANSLFCDYLLGHGLKVHNDYTRDIICLEFNYGSRSYEQELIHLRKLAGETRLLLQSAKLAHDDFLASVYRNKLNKISFLIRQGHNYKKDFEKKSVQELRKKYYNEGVDVNYITYFADGTERRREAVHYRMLYRSTGKAKKGTCMFICDRLYKKAKKFLYMGIKLPEDNPQIVEISAYAPLVSSSICGRIEIDPNSILVLDDVKKTFNAKVISVELGEDKHCVAREIDDYEVSNTMFDGQALIDSSIFPDWGDGFILLRQHFCKMAAFKTNIQQFFKDRFGDGYESAAVKDYFGNIRYLKNIKLITTTEAMKWLKFGVTWNYWCRRVRENGCVFGIVKTAHQSKFGEVQRMSYQMVNALDESIMPDVIAESDRYIMSLKNDDDAFFDFLRKNSNFSNDHEVLIFLCEHNPEFIRSHYFRRRRTEIINTYVRDMKCGHIIQNADNLVIVGSPYAMLLYASTGRKESCDEDDTFTVEEDAIQCYTERFEDGAHLASFRSPFNSKNNMGFLHNVYSPPMKRYFPFGKQIIAVNMNGTDFQDRNNGLLINGSVCRKLHPKNIR